ncbi:MAG: hypothetical protein ACK4NW_04500 [Roseinatronobacter sp.]
MIDFRFFSNVSGKVAVAILVAGTALAAPVSAGGVNDTHARAMAKIIKGDAHGIRGPQASAQQNNTVHVHQTGNGNRALIRQVGTNNTVDLEQLNGNNGQVIIQLGSGSTADVTQTGGQSGVIVQFGK